MNPLSSDEEASAADDNAIRLADEPAKGPRLLQCHDQSEHQAFLSEELSIDTNTLHTGLYTESHIRSTDHCCRKFWCFCCPAQSSRNEEQLERKKDSDCGVLVIVIGLIVFSLAYYFSRTNIYTIVKLNNPPWTYQCQVGPLPQCIRVRYKGHSDELLRDRNQCMMTCGVETSVAPIFWPRPTGPVSLSNATMNFLPADVKIIIDSNNPEPAASMMKEWRPWLKSELYFKHPSYDYSQLNPFVGMKSDSAISVLVSITNGTLSVGPDLDESYELVLTRNDRLDQEAAFFVEIKAGTYFGAKQALDTFLQLVSFNEITETLQIYTRAYVQDRPKYSVRALKVDTSQSYFHLNSMESILEGMSVAKLNLLHWKLFGSASFPLHLEPIRELARFGSFHPNQVYTLADVEHLKHFGLVRGIQVVPEIDVLDFDAGWTFEPSLLQTCPQTCNSSPCAQLNFTSDRVWRRLEIIADEMYEGFGSTIWHLGTAKDALNCPLFHGPFHDIESVMVQIRLILSRATSGPVKHLLTEIAPTKGDLPSLKATWDPKIDILVVSKFERTNLDTRGFPVLLSVPLECERELRKRGECHAKDLDNSLNALAEWRHLYEMDWTSRGSRIQSLIVGSELNLSDSGVDEYNIHGKLWPRASLFAEELWSGHDYIEDESMTLERLRNHRKRLILRGLPADTIPHD